MKIVRTFTSPWMYWYASLLIMIISSRAAAAGRAQSRRGRPENHAAPLTVAYLGKNGSKRPTAPS